MYIIVLYYISYFNYMFIPQEINFSFNLIFNLAQGSATMAEIMMKEQLKYKSGGATGRGSDDLTLVKREAELTTTYHIRYESQEKSRVIPLVVEVDTPYKPVQLRQKPSFFEIFQR